MATINIICFLGVLACLTETAYGQCLPAANSYNFGIYGAGSLCNECPLNAPADTLAASNGGGFPVISSSPVPPYGVSVVSDNEFGGILASIGELPFLGTTYLEGVVPSVGVGAVTYGCGSGNVGIVTEDYAGAASRLGYTDGIIGGTGLTSRLCGLGYNSVGGCRCGGFF